jgi:hypothetical protein
MQKKLIIVGCSWGCGEWQVDQNKVISISHPGIAAYLSTDYDVVNLSRGGGSNWQSCFALRNYLNYVNNFDLCQIIVMQTDAFRPNSSKQYQVDYDHLYQDSLSLLDFYQKTLEIFYIKLDLLAKEYNLKIHLVGGLTDLDIHTISLYNNLIPMCESWVHLIDNTHTPSIIPLILNPGLLTAVKEHNRIDLLDEIVQYSDQNFLKAQELMETEYFGPSFGDFHPSRQGHKLLSNYIKEFLTKEIQ